MTETRRKPVVIDVRPGETPAPRVSEAAAVPDACTEPAAKTVSRPET